jgi:hypothetical protein
MCIMAMKPGKPNIQRSVGITGTATDPTIEQDNTSPKAASGHGGKVENDFNQMGEQKPTQRNEGQRTANSRSDRESHVGGSNQLQSRRGTTGR